MVIVICAVGQLFLAMYNPKNYFSWFAAEKSNPLFLSYIMFKQSVRLKMVVKKNCSLGNVIAV